jgi:hypothetical protein
MLSRDEQAARNQIASTSVARHAEDAAELSKSNAEAVRRRMAAGPRTDASIDDEAAGIARRQLASESKECRAKKAAELMRQNAEMLNRRRAASSRTEAHLSDEAARHARRHLAEASKARREAEASELTRRNEELAERLRAARSRTDDGDGGGIFEKVNLVPLDRESEMWRASYLKLEVQHKNYGIGEQLRLAKTDLQSQRSRQEIVRITEAHELVRERRAREERLRQVRSDVLRSNRRIVRSVRKEAAQLENQRNEQERSHYEQARARVLEASALDAKLDLLETAQEARAREEGKRLNMELSQALFEKRSEIMLQNRDLAETVASARSAALSAHSTCFSPKRGEAKREASKEWQRQRQEREGEYLSLARAYRARAEQQRARTRKSLLQLLKRRKKSAAKERSNDYLVAEEKRRILEGNRKEVAAIYRRRFASKQEAQHMWSRTSAMDASSASAASQSSRATNPRSK